jgi:hypothetical protein
MKSLINSFDEQFSRLHRRSTEFVKMIPDEMLFQTPREMPDSFVMFSCGEYVLRSAAAVEQTFGGIMTRLWDDPFEWTLPEALSSTVLIQAYLEEVEETRRKGFEFFGSDADLTRELPAPEKLKTIHTVLLETLARAENYQGRAFAVFQMYSDEKLPRI